MMHKNEIIYGENPQRLRMRSLISLLICCAYCVSVLMLDIGNPLIPHVFFLLWIGSLFILEWNRISKILSRQYFVYIYIFIIYYFLSSLFVEDIETCIHRVIGMCELVSPLVMYEIYKTSGKGATSIVVYIITALAVYNIFYLTQNAAATGMGLRQDAEDEGFIETAYHWVYSLSILEGLLVFTIRKVLQTQLKYKFIILLFLICFAVVVFVTVISAFFSTALIIMLLGIIIALLYGRKKWKSKLFALIFAGVLFYSALLPMIINILGKISPDAQFYANRALEISDILSGTVNSNASSGERLILTKVSIETFLIHPLFGINPLTSDVIARLPVVPGTKIGNHAQWIDGLGLYGVFALCLYVFLWKYVKRVYKPELFVVFALYFLLGFLNTCFYYVHMTLLFFYAPLLYDYILSFRKMKE